MRVIAANAVPLVALRMRASIQAVSVMIPEATDWIVANDADVAVCPQCLGDDDAAGTPRFRRREWAQCWQVLCVRHRLPLVDMRGWRSGRLELEPVRAEHTDAAKRQWPDRRTGQARKSRAVWAGRDECDRPDGGRHPRCPRGRRPHAPSWGDIEPVGFLRVVCDVTTFVLSGFVADDRARLSVFAIFIASGLGIRSAASNGYASDRQMQGRAASPACPALRTSARSGGGGVRSSGRAN